MLFVTLSNNSFLISRLKPVLVCFCCYDCDHELTVNFAFSARIGRHFGRKKLTVFAILHKEIVC